MQLVKYLFLILLGSVTYGCALQGSIDGGPRDTRAPQVVNSNPKNETTNFQSSEIKIKMNEFFKLNDPTTTMFIVPSDVKLEAVAQDKELILKIKGQLHKETTYAIYLNKTIKDIHESNDTLMTYVFSTGNWIDSLTYSGVVLNALSRLPYPKINVCLLSDSATNFSQKANYFTTTNDKGEFSFSYLKQGKYHVIAFDDKSKDMIPQAFEYVGFTKQAVNIAKNTKDSLPILVFPPMPKRLIRHASFVGPNQIILGANNELKSARFFLKDKEIKPFIQPHGTDSLSLFTDVHTLDTIPLHIQTSTTKDSAYLRLPLKEKQKAPRFWTDNKQLPMQPIVVYFSDLVSSFNKDSIQVFANDTLPMKIQVSKNSENSIAIQLPKNEFKNLKVRFLNNSLRFKNYTGNYKTELPITVMEEKQIGNVIAKIDSIPTGTIIELFQGTNWIESHIKQANEKTYTFGYLEKGDYNIRFILDENKNGRWDTGSLTLKKQAEETRWSNETITVRPNWDIEVVLDLKKGR
jgi:uncharacterized protein (DUF2141 family)